jgi:hypothetical protein
MSAKVLENRIRRVAARRGFMLTKSRRRDPRALDFGQYTLTDQHGKSHVFATLAEVERALA